ncbi:MAG: nitrate/nitrite transporter NrtS [Thainema sp.]
MLKPFVNTLNDSSAVSRSAKVAVVVGTILLAINHGKAIAQDKMSTDRWISAGLTYMVPFMVSLHGQSMQRKAR